MITYQLTINDDFSSTLVFGSTAPDNFDGVEGTVRDDAEEVLEPIDGPTVEAGSFVASTHIKIPNYDCFGGLQPVLRFTEDQMVEGFVLGNLEVLKGMSKDVLSVPTTPEETSTPTNPEYPESIEIQANIVRNQRNTLLMESDWTQAADSPLSDDDKAAWATYRTSLRNLSDHANWPELLPEDWPAKP